MSLACIIERDALVTRQIERALSEVDGKLSVKSFSNLEEFYKWFSHSIKQPEEEGQREDIKLLIGDIQFLGPRYFTLIEKVRKLMVRRNLIRREEDLAVLLTTFEAPDLNYKQIESRIITNLIFKPFDVPILKQHLQVALAQQKAITEYLIYNQKLPTTAEMLKEVQLESFNELGFTTRSNRDLKVNDVSKYYSHHFEIVGRASVLARCLSCRPHPQRPTEFIAEFRYVGLANAQAKKLRQVLFSAELDSRKTQEVTRTVAPRATQKQKHLDPEVNFLMFLGGDHDQVLEIKDCLDHNLCCYSLMVNNQISKFLEALKKNDATVLGHKPIQGIFLNANLFSSDKGIDSWTRIVSQIEDFNTKLKAPQPRPKFFLVSYELIDEAHLRAWSKLVEDVIQLPVDRPYLNKRLLNLFPQLKPANEPIEFLSTLTHEIITVANPIEVSSISEACLTIKYYRPISFHAFRRFCLPSSNGSRADELLASCFYNEKKDGVYINHFVFFGITDKYLKYLRKWILERYIASKESAA